MIARILRLLLERRLFAIGRRTGTLVSRNHTPEAFEQDSAENGPDDPWLAACARAALSNVHDGASK